MPRKRTADVAELDHTLEPVAAVPAEEQAILSRLRNMWEFASLMQYIFLFGHVVKIDDDFDIEVCDCGTDERRARTRTWPWTLFYARRNGMLMTIL